ncbi:tetratricopeptide repeat protein [Treponema sp.]|uniref:tetratricopeptide repeat protein n=1 Tax=Treponema sp. TaxID=166 RepID=UPI00298E0001|nr:tetratricopeptide repeat protein [Treponema sp.]MCR5613100.1 tetratricopeptide repeat protein [Treponema sp.]
MIERAESLNTQAISLAANGDFTEAIACFKRALVVEKSNYLLWFNLGVTYRDAGKLNSAKECLLKAYDIEPCDQDVIETLAIICLSMEQTEEALMYCTEGLYYYPLNAHLWNTMGVIYFSQALYKDASEAFERAISINPYYYDALFNLRDTYDELGNKVGKEECIQRMRGLKTSSN